MYCTFHVANLGEIAEGITLGWFWMCRTDFQVDERDNMYSIKVNSITLIGNRSPKTPKEVQKIMSLWETSSKPTVISTMET